MPHSSPSPKSLFHKKVTMGSKPSVTEVEKDVFCAARLCSLFLMIKIICTISDDQALSNAYVNFAIWKIIVASCDGTSTLCQHQDNTCL